MNVAAWLRREGASEDIAGWAERYGDDLGALWTSCPRGDWLLAVAARLAVDGRAIARAALEVGRLALDVLPDDDEALATFETLTASDRDGSALADALEARSDAAGDPALATALLALSCVARSSVDPSAAPMVAALSTQALVFDAQECGAMSVVGWAQSTAADRVRAAIALEQVLDAYARQGGA